MTILVLKAFSTLNVNFSNKFRLGIRIIVFDLNKIVSTISVCILIDSVAILVLFIWLCIIEFVLVFTQCTVDMEILP